MVDIAQLERRAHFHHLGRFRQIEILVLGDDDAGALGACAQDNGVLAQGTCAFEALDVDRVVELPQSLVLLLADLYPRSFLRDFIGRRQRGHHQVEAAALLVKREGLVVDFDGRIGELLDLDTCLQTAAGQLERTLAHLLGLVFRERKQKFLGQFVDGSHLTGHPTAWRGDLVLHIAGHRQLHLLFFIAHLQLLLVDGKQLSALLRQEEGEVEGIVRRGTIVAVRIIEGHASLTLILSVVDLCLEDHLLLADGSRQPLRSRRGHDILQLALDVLQFAVDIERIGQLHALDDAIGYLQIVEHGVVSLRERERLLHRLVVNLATIGIIERDECGTVIRFAQHLGGDNHRVALSHHLRPVHILARQLISN